MLFEWQIDFVSKLALHQSRRCQGIPTLSVLVGQPLAVKYVWNQWLEQTQRQSGTCVYTSKLSLLQAWLLTVVKNYELSYLVVERLAKVTDQPSGQLATWLKNTSEYQTRLFWQRLSLKPREIDWLRLFLNWTAEFSSSLHQDSIPLPNWLQEDDLPAITQGFTIVEQLLGGQAVPGLLIDLSAPAIVAESVSVIGLLSKLVEMLPRLPICLSLTNIQSESFLTQLPESRAMAMVRSGLLEINPPESRLLKSWLCDRNITDPIRQQTILKITDQYGSTPDFLEAVVELTQPSVDQGIEQQHYRSQSERFLFQCLEGRPQTTGKFQVNRTLDIRFGNRPMEVDFFAADTKIVIEIDGYYHFQSPDNYRRDRRKDVELQQHGFLVLRFLADDVVSHLEEILDTIDRAITQRST